MLTYMEIPDYIRIIYCIVMSLLMVVNEAVVVIVIVKVPEAKFRGFKSLYMFFVCILCFIILQYSGATEMILYRGRPYPEMDHFMGRLPWIIPIGIGMLILVYTLYILHGIVKWWKKNLSFYSIRESIEAIPEGLCYYADNGRPFVVNTTMNDISFSLCGTPIRNVKEFLNGIRDGNYISRDNIVLEDENVFLVEADGGIYSFRDTIIKDSIGSFHELKVADVTEEYSKIQELEKKQEELKEQQEYLRELGETITQLTIEKEILDAKIRVHDKLGESLIVAKRYILTGDGDPESIKSLWNDNLKLLAESTEEKSIEERENPLTSILKAAQDIGIAVEIKGEIPSEERVTRIVANALHECVTNTIRHAHGDTVYITVEGDGAKITFANNGNPPRGKVSENGGLRNLRNNVEKSGYKMMIVSKPQFKLILIDKTKSLKGE